MARSSGPSAKWLGFPNARPSRSDFDIVRQSARVVPLRTVNKELIRRGARTPKLDSQTALSNRAGGRAADGLRRKHGRYGHRDATMILVAYRHGLRASEVCDLQWQQIELSEGRLHVHRVKNAFPACI